MAEKLSGPITGRHTNNFYLKIISEHINKGGGGGYDDTVIKRRITAVENGKQDKLTAGQGILIEANTISAKNIIDDTKNSLTTVWSSNKVKSLFESIQGGVDIVITATRPDESLAVEKTMYYVGTEAPYHIWFFVNEEYADFGTTDISLENYYTKDEVDELLGLKVNKETGKVLIPTSDLAQITTNKNDIVNLEGEKVDKETGKVLIPLTDLAQITTNKNNIADLDSEKVDKESGKVLIPTTDLAQITTNKNNITSLSNDKVDKVTGKSLVLDTDIAQITTNKNDIADLDSDKVDKETGKSLVLNTDIAQITTNKVDIANIKDDNDLTSFRKVKLALDEKQDNLTAGQNITISGNTISAREIIDDTINSPTTVWSSKKVKELIEALEGGVTVSVVATRPDPSVAVDKTMYYVGTGAPYHIWFFVNNSYTDVGTTDINLENYYTKDEVDALLDLKVDKVTGKSLVLNTDIAQITTNKNDIADLDSDKVDKVTGKSLVLDTDITQITTNKTDIANIKDDVNLTSFSKVKLALGEKQDAITDSTLDSISDSTTVSSVSASSKTNKTFSLSALWTWITGKLSTTISSSSTDTQIPSAKAVWDSVYTGVLNYSSMSGLNDILSAVNVQDGCSKFAYITNLTPAKTAGASKNEGYIKVSKNNNKAMIEFFPYDDAERWWAIKNTTWGDWTNGAKYMHTLVRYNNESKEYTMGWFSIINEKKTITLAEIKEWLSENDYTSIQSTYHWCGGCLGTTGVRNMADTGTAYVGKVASGVYYNTSSDTIFFKWDYNGTTSIVEGKYDIISTRLS